MRHVSSLSRGLTLIASLAVPICLVTAAGFSRVSAQPPSRPSGETAGNSKMFKKTAGC